jgi:hypothetical protein
MGKMCPVRSAVEHLHEHRYLETFDRTERLDHVQQAGGDCGAYCSQRARSHHHQSSYLAPFGNTAALGPLWQLSPADRQKLWGSASIEPAEALADFDPEFISDSDLGA